MVPLSPSEEAVWRALAKLLVVLPRAVNSDLKANAGLGLSEYMVLMALSEREGNQMCVSDLAASISLSQAQASRLIDAMAKEGLVRRERSMVDCRSRMTTLTPAGMTRLQHAWPAHLASTRRLVVDNLDPQALPVLQRAFDAVVQAAESTLACRTGDSAVQDGIADMPGDGLS